LGRGECVGTGVEEVESGEDEEGEGHAGGIGGGVLSWEEGEETAFPVFDVLGDVEVRFFFWEICHF
jgi:hypothetical protein